jgi:formylglycine-generating enzyme required for sulfatase activity
MLGTALISFGLRQVIGDGVEDVLGVIHDHLNDPTQALPEALTRAHERSWKALEVSLTERTVLGRLAGRLFQSAADRAICEQIKEFLDQSDWHSREPAEFRKNCLDELQQARRAGELSIEQLNPQQVVDQTKQCPFCAEHDTLIHGAQNKLLALADDLKARNYTNLAELLRHPPPNNNQPLLVAAFGYFFRVELEANPELASTVMRKDLESVKERLCLLSGSQERHFALLHEAFLQQGDRLEAVLREAHRDLQQLIEARFNELSVKIDEIREHLVGGATPMEPRGQPGRQVCPNTVTITLKPGVEMGFVHIPPGSFWMGSPATERGRTGNERLHRVTLNRGFHLGVIPVTQAQWQAIMGNNPSEFRGEDHPVENVSWEDCQGFLRQLGEQTGYRYRLPSEAEWEYACRGGTPNAFHAGDKEADLLKVGWCRGNRQGEEGTRPVQQLAPNFWGLYDVHGNVMEWCADWYDEYPEGAQMDPQGSPTGMDRVIRGGSWWSSPFGCRAAFRGMANPGTRSEVIGLRVVLMEGVPVQQLAEVEFFRAVPTPLLEELARQTQRRRCQPGEVIIHQGESGTDFFMLQRGEVAITQSSSGQPPQERGRIRAPGFFGEGALLTHQPRNATVTAASECELYILSQESMNRVLEARPGALARVRKALRARLRSNQEAETASRSSL